MAIEKLYPECKDYLWGGTRLVDEYGKQTQKRPCAESWELSFHGDGLTRLSNGKTLMESVSEKELGANLAQFPFFPTLVKLIDARDNLSVQVHPSDSYALKNENSFGKTEMWYIVDADEGAGIYLGFNREVTESEFRQAIAQNTLTDLLNFYQVKKGECYFIPAGVMHAIGKGCLIYEVQQNSNLTYRVYDYGRVGADGKPRQLHIDKALAVTNPKAFTPKSWCNSKYFTATLERIDSERVFQTDGSTFQCVTCVNGKGEIDGQTMRKGDSFFVPATHGKYTMNGNMEIVMAEIRKYYIGIDLGGTFIKGGIVNDLGEIILSDKVPTQSDKGADKVAQNIVDLAKMLVEKAGMQISDMQGVGVGVPGTIDSKAGVVVYANNLHWEHFALGEKIEKELGLPVKLANDANVAALGETKFGCGKDYDSTVLVTLGTGVGGGIVIDGKLFEGNHGAGAEIGHTVICAFGEPCTCGRAGCFETYSSATALIRDTKRAMQANKNSKMWEIGDLDKVTGKTAFDYAPVDESAKMVVDNYIKMLGVGLTNIANEFRPEVIMLGGGVCAQGDNLVKPLQAFLDREIYAGDKGPYVKILTATLGNSAGLLGAAALFMD